MDRLLNYISFLILIYIFALWAPASIHGTIIIGLVASFIISAIAFVYNWLSLDGAGAAIVIGTFTFGLGGWPTIIALLFFFLSSALISINNSTHDDYDARRNGLQVWANGFWVVWWLLAGMLTNTLVCWLAASAAIAVATADTWATELGSRRFDVKTYLAVSFKEVPAGSQGGVSWPGLVASLAGSGLVAVIACVGFSIPLIWFFFILIAGVAGSLFDSYLGATLQGTTQKIQWPQINWVKEININNNMVNWLATGFGSLLILILNFVFYEVV